MSKRPEPENVEFFVGGVEPDATASLETARAIEAYKRRPDYHLEAEEAERILASLGIHPRDYGMQDAKSLLDNWHHCVADLLKADRGETPVAQVDQENIGARTD
jgi:predicted signal transduction protein with EAL and GGDEF domain